LLAPEGTSREIVMHYNSTVNEILRQQKIVDLLAKQGLTTVGGTPDQLGRFIAADVAKWQNVVKEAGITAE
jgi:tripartite-type tricarboxylate transporter receptor subunit TctC